MELAIVSHRSTAGRCDAGQLTRLSLRLAEYSWDALYAGRREAPVATELARRLGVDLIVARDVDPARLIAENPGGRSGVRTVSCLNDTLHLVQVEAGRSAAAADDKAPQLYPERAVSV